MSIKLDSKSLTHDEFEQLLLISDFELEKDYTKTFTCEDICVMKITIPKHMINNKEILLNIYTQNKHDFKTKESCIYTILSVYLDKMIDDAINTLIHYGEGNGCVFQNQIARWNFGNVDLMIHNITLKIETNVSERYSQIKGSPTTASQKYMELNHKMPDWRKWTTLTTERPKINISGKRTYIECD